MALSVSVLKDAIRESREDDITGLAAELAYRMFFAIFPFFIFLAAVSGFGADVLAIENPAERIVEHIGEAMPADSAETLERELSAIFENQSVGLLTTGAVGALWAATSGMNTVMKSLNRVYGVEESRPWWRKYPLAIALTTASSLFVVAAFASIVGGQLFANSLAGAFGFGDAARPLVEYSRLPVGAIFLAFAVAMIYWVTPNADIPFKWITPGAVLFIVLWIVGTVALGFYAANFASYGATYGTLGGVVLLMTWLYVTAFVLLFGAELNSVLDEHAAPGTVDPSRDSSLDREDGPASGRPYPGEQRRRDTAAPPFRLAAIALVAAHAFRNGARSRESRR